MGYKYTNLISESGDNEIQFTGWHALDALLNNVISILVFNTSHYMGTQLLNYVNLRFQWDRFKSLLNHSTTIHLHGEIDNLAVQTL